MRFFLLFVLLAAAEAATDFHWEFDFRQCEHRGFSSSRFSCYAPVNGNLTYIEREVTERIDYQMHPHVIAINVQSADRWHVVMQSRYRKQKVDTNFGMIVHKIPETGKEEKFFDCKVLNGQVKVSSSPDIETELVDSYFDDYHLYCDFIVKSKKNTGKTLTDVVTIRDKFALSVIVNQMLQKYVDDYVPRSYVSSMDDDSITTVSRYFEEHTCDLSQVKYDPSEAPKTGKVRSWEVYYDHDIKCPDFRYILHVSDSKGRKMKNAKIECSDGKYKISNNYFSLDSKEWTVELNETFNAFCHVEDSLLCPISMPCDGDNCPYVEFDNIYYMRYSLECSDKIYDLLVAGEREIVIGKASELYKVNCNSEHKLTVQRDTSESRKRGDPPVVTTEAYCVKEDAFKHPNCARRNPLCNGKSCSIVKSKDYEYTLTCTNTSHVFQEFSTKSNSWIPHKNILECKKDGEWANSGQFSRCKDPADTTPPAATKATSKNATTSSSNKSTEAESEKSISTQGEVNGHRMSAFSSSLLLALSWLIA